MRRHTKWIAGTAIALVLVGGGAGVALAAGVADDDQPLTGATFDTAVAAALKDTGGGTVTETEAGDDGAVHSVEIRLDNGVEVEINLDEKFSVISRENDDDRDDDDRDDVEDDADDRD